MAALNDTFSCTAGASVSHCNRSNSATMLSCTQSAKLRAPGAAQPARQPLLARLSRANAVVSAGPRCNAMIGPMRTVSQKVRALAHSPKVSVGMCFLPFCTTLDLLTAC